MCIINKTYYSYSFDYSLNLNFHKSGGVSGFLASSDNYAIKYPLRGCYVYQNDVVMFTFSVDWFFPGEDNWGFTCFSGHFVNKHVLIMDWMLIENGIKNNFAITGSDCLCSSLFFLNGRREQVNNNIRPFPIDVEFAKSAKTLT